MLFRKALLLTKRSARIKCPNFAVSPLLYFVALAWNKFHLSVKRCHSAHFFLDSAGFPPHQAFISNFPRFLSSQMIFLTRVPSSSGNLLCGDSCFPGFPSLQDIFLNRFLYPQSFFLARVSASLGYPQQGSLRNWSFLNKISSSPRFSPLQNFLSRVYSLAFFTPHPGFPSQQSSPP
jgi:hypothetical protein